VVDDRKFVRVDEPASYAVTSFNDVTPRMRSPRTREYLAKNEGEWLSRWTDKYVKPDGTIDPDARRPVVVRTQEAIHGTALASRKSSSDRPGSAARHSSGTGTATGTYAQSATRNLTLDQGGAAAMAVPRVMSGDMIGLGLAAFPNRLPGSDGSISVVNMETTGAGSSGGGNNNARPSKAAAGSGSIKEVNEDETAGDSGKGGNSNSARPMGGNDTTTRPGSGDSRASRGSGLGGAAGRYQVSLPGSIQGSDDEDNDIRQLLVSHTVMDVGSDEDTPEMASSPARGKGKGKGRGGGKGKARAFPNITA
jgi:hypothetical protein